MFWTKKFHSWQEGHSNRGHNKNILQRIRLEEVSHAKTYIKNTFWRSDTQIRKTNPEEAARNIWSKGDRSFEEQISCLPQPGSLGRPNKCFWERGTLPKPRGTVLAGVWTRFDSLGQIRNGLLKAGIGALMIETRQIMHQECVVTSPRRGAAFNKKTQLWKLRSSMHYPYSLKLEQNPRKCRHLLSLTLHLFPVVT